MHAVAQMNLEALFSVKETSTKGYIVYDFIHRKSRLRKTIYVENRLVIAQE